MQQRSTMTPTTPTEDGGTRPKTNNLEPRSTRNPWKQKARDVAPIHGASLNNNAENDDHTERDPQRPAQRRAPSEGPSYIGCLKTLEVQSGDSAQNPPDTHLYNAGRNRNTKGPLISTNGRVKQPPYIDLNIDTYSRDAVGRSPDSDIYVYTARLVSHSPDDHRRSTATLNRVPEEMESGASTPERRQQNRRSNLMLRGQSPQRYYGSVGHGATSSRGYLEGGLVDEESDLNDNEEAEEWLLDEELARQGLYRGTLQRQLLEGAYILTL